MVSLRSNSRTSRFLCWMHLAPSTTWFIRWRTSAGSVHHMIHKVINICWLHPTHDSQGDEHLLARPRHDSQGDEHLLAPSIWFTRWWTPAGSVHDMIHKVMNTCWLCSRHDSQGDEHLLAPSTNIPLPPSFIFSFTNKVLWLRQWFIIDVRTVVLHPHLYLTFWLGSLTQLSTCLTRWCTYVRVPYYFLEATGTWVPD